jgi:hypothetical protein
MELWMEEVINKKSDLKLKFRLRVKNLDSLRFFEIKSGFSNLLCRKSMSLA